MDDDENAEEVIVKSVQPSREQAGKIELDQSVTEGINFLSIRCGLIHHVSPDTNLDDIADQQRRYIVTNLRLMQKAIAESA